MKACFVLPGESRAGGTRVTVEMAHRLRARGLDTRIAYRQQRGGSLRHLVRKVRRLAFRNAGWLSHFEGPVLRFDDLGQVAWAPDEVVISVGPQCLREVAALPDSVLKLHYCHGFPDHEPALIEQIRGTPIPTIAVSPTLVPRLESLTGLPVVGVVPNGIDLGHYRPLEVPRDGIGAIYNTLSIKSPQDTLALYERIGERWPHLRRRLFGIERRPRGVARPDYRRFPSIPEACRIYSSSMLWLVTSRAEGFSLPILEAMACATVVVSTDTLGARSLITSGVNGELVPIGDLTAFEKVIGELLEDAPRRARLAAGGMATAAEYSWDKAVDRMLELLAQLGPNPSGRS